MKVIRVRNRSYAAVSISLLAAAAGMGTISSEAAAQVAQEPSGKLPPEIANAPIVPLPDPRPAFPRAVSGLTGGPIELPDQIRSVRTRRQFRLATQSLSYSTTFIDEESSLSESGLTVYSSTSPGTFALTGTVLDAAGNPVISAAVNVVPSSGGTTVATTTDADGAFAFVDVPVVGTAQAFNLNVAKGGFGNYAVTNDPYEASGTYLTSVELDTTTQTYDEGHSLADSTVGFLSAGSAGYSSQERVPPTLKVALYPLDDKCARKSDSRRAVKKLPMEVLYLAHRGI